MSLGFYVLIQEMQNGTEKNLTMSINGQLEHQDFTNLILNLGANEHFPTT